jgi:hypothetical protein
MRTDQRELGRGDDDQKGEERQQQPEAQHDAGERAREGRLCGTWARCGWKRGGRRKCRRDSDAGVW